MTVHFSDGFESGNFTNWDASQVVGASNAISICTEQVYAGTYATKVHIENATDADYARLYKKWHATGIGTGQHIWASAHFFFPTGFDCEDYIRLIHFTEDLTPWNGFALFLDSSEQLYVYDYINTATYTQAAPIAVPTNEWCGIELHIYVHDTEGYVEVRQDGVVILSQTNIDSLPASDYTKAYFGAGRIGNHTGPDNFYFDEVYIQDSQKIPAPTVDETPLRIKGVIQHDLDETSLRIKGNIYYAVDQTPTRIKGVIQRDYAAFPLRIKGTIWRTIYETFGADIRALTADANQSALRIKGKISLPVSLILNSDIRGQTGIIQSLTRIKGTISNSAAQTPARIKGIISGPHTETALRLKGFILGQPEDTILRIKGSISHDVEDLIRIKGVIKQDYSAAALRIKGLIWNQVSTIRIKGKISRDYDTVPLRIKGTLLPVFDKPVLRIKGNIVHGVEHYTRIKGKIHGIISTIRIKGNIYYGVDQSSLRIKGIIGTPSDEAPLRIKGVIRRDLTQTPLRIKGEIGKKRPIELERQEPWTVVDGERWVEKSDKWTETEGR